MTRIESGAMEPNFGFHYVGDIVGTALSRAKKIIGLRKTEVAIPPDLPMLRVDPVLFEQVLFNLLDNAAKYAPEGSLVRIQAWTDDGWVVLQVMDEGPGIPAEDLERVFDTFYRVRKGDQVTAGTGLGLSISRGFIEAMGGTITAERRADRSGAIFTIRMPIPKETPDPEEFMTNSNVKILIVDDEAPIRKLLRVGLSTQDYNVSEAQSARTAIEQVGITQPDLILLDLGLPDMSGHELLRRWRDEGAELPVVILSSRTDEKGIVEALELGADDYVTKPFGMNELVARIRVALRHRLQQQGERPIFETGGLSVDLVKRIVKVDGKEVKLSPKEYEILRVLVQHAGKALTHRFLLARVWGDTTDVQYLRVYVRQLRQKIERLPDQPQYITTETGVGYRLRETEE